MKKGNKFSFMEWEDGREKGKIFKQKSKDSLLKKESKLEHNPSLKKKPNLKTGMIHRLHFCCVRVYVCILLCRYAPTFGDVCACVYYSNFFHKLLALSIHRIHFLGSSLNTQTKWLKKYKYWVQYW